MVNNVPSTLDPLVFVENIIGQEKNVYDKPFALATPPNQACDFH